MRQLENWNRQSISYEPDILAILEQAFVKNESGWNFNQIY